MFIFSRDVTAIFFDCNFEKNGNGGGRGNGKHTNNGKTTTHKRRGGRSVRSFGFLPFVPFVGRSRPADKRRKKKYPRRRAVHCSTKTE